MSKQDSQLNELTLETQVYKIGSFEFPTRAKAVDYTRELLIQIGRYTPIYPNHPDYLFFVALLEHHPEKQRKIGSGIQCFGIQRNKRDPKCLETFILRTDGSKETFSWKDCASQKWKTPEQKLYKAFRTTIDPQIINFHSTTPEICAHCGKQTKCSVDHKNPTFKKLTLDFLALNTLPVPTIFAKKPKTNEEIFADTDNDFNNNWIQYHQKNAVLQLLCDECHKEKTVNDNRENYLLSHPQSSEIAQELSDTSVVLG